MPSVPCACAATFFSHIAASCTTASSSCWLYCGAPAVAARGGDPRRGRARRVRVPPPRFVWGGGGEVALVGGGGPAAWGVRVRVDRPGRRGGRPEIDPGGAGGHRQLRSGSDDLVA